MFERWKSIKGYDEYMISNMGRVKSLKRGKQKILKPKTTTYGYLSVNLYKNGIERTFEIHRLVGETFLENPLNLPEINHKDENKRNSRLENLEWCTRKYNINYGTGIERRKKNTDNILLSKKRKKAILQYDIAGKLIREWESAKDIQIELGFNKSCICRACRGNVASSYGFVWEYKEYGGAKCLEG